MGKIGTKSIDYHSGSYQGRPVVVVEENDGCLSVISHTPNKDGYIRKCFLVDGKKKLIMYHRHVWERYYGEIPEGYEVDHMCRNRKCCNIDHLQLLTKSEHKTKTNEERYAERINGIREAIKQGKETKEIAEAFNVTTSTINRYKRLLSKG